MPIIVGDNTRVLSELWPLVNENVVTWHARVSKYVAENQIATEGQAA